MSFQEKARQMVLIALNKDNLPQRLTFKLYEQNTEKYITTVVKFLRYDKKGLTRRKITSILNGISSSLTMILIA